MKKKQTSQNESKNTLNRRQFLKAGVAAGAAGTFSMGTLGCGAKTGQKEEYPDVPENKVQLPPNGKSVLILGGGFGGMHAACELLDRGFQVTIIEKTSQLGGKLKSWRDMTFGSPSPDDTNWKGYPRDHGIHAVWGFYNNLREFMGRHGYRLWKMPKETTMYNFVDKDGSEVDFAHATTMPWPFSRMQLARGVLNAFNYLSGEDLEIMNTFILKILSFDFEDIDQRMYLDSISFPKWARSIGIPERLIYRFFHPLSDMAMFDHIDDSSALYTLMLIALAGGSYDDTHIDIFTHPPGETYIAPIENYIKARGGKIIYNTPVRKIIKNGDYINSVLVGYEGVDPSGKSWRCNVCGSVFKASVKPSRCPVCGAPASQIVPVSATTKKEFKADYYIVAMDIPGAQAVLAASGLNGNPYFDNIYKLEATSVYPVDLWYDNCESWEKRFPRHMNFYSSNFKLLGITLNWALNGEFEGKKVTEPLLPEYANRKLNIIETQVADTSRVKNKSDEEIARLVHEELKIVMKDLPDPTDFYVNRWDNYTPQRVGNEALRPPIQSPVDNLFLIGDWVRTDHLSVYMEKTNVASKMVTNLILDKAGQKRGKIKILKSGTSCMFLNSIKKIASIYP